VAAEVIAQYAFDSIADHGPGIDLARNCKTDSRGPVVGQVMHRHHRGGSAMAAFEDGVKFRTRAHPRTARVAGIAFRDRALAGHERYTFMTRASCLGACFGDDGRIGPVAVPKQSGGEARTAFGAAAGKNLAAIGGFHAGTETVIALTLEIAGLVGALGGHDSGSVVRAVLWRGDDGTAPKRNTGTARTVKYAGPAPVRSNPRGAIH
jgi:hypothetical protein